MNGRVTQRSFRYFRSALWLTLVSGLTLLSVSPVWAEPVNGGAVGAVKGTGDTRLGGVEFKQARVRDAIRVISEQSGVNIVATKEAADKEVTFFIRDLTVDQALDSMCRVTGLWYRFNEKTGVYLVMTTEEYQRDMVVFTEEHTRVFNLKYLNVAIAAHTIEDLFGDRVQLNASTKKTEYGDDFEIEGLSAFTGGSSSNQTSNTKSKRAMKSGGLKRSKQDDANILQESEKLTPEQLAALSQLAGGQQVSGTQIRQVAQRQEAPIYVTVNRLHNLLFVRTSDLRALDEVARVIKASDRPIPQVLLEMKVLEVQLTDANVSAFDLSYIGGSQTSGPDDGHAVNPLNSAATSVGSALLGLGNFSVQEGNSFVFQLLNDHIRARLQALKQDDNVKTLATPMLLSSNNKPARIFIGEQMVLTTGYETGSSGSGGSNNNYYAVPTPVTEVTDVGNTLTILPSINADRSVVMRLIHENSSPAIGGGRITVVAGGSTHEVPIDTVDKSTMEGTVLAKDGYTVAVGGMMRVSNTDNESKVPVLGDIPLLGMAFKQKEKTSTKTELVLLITPHVLFPGAESEQVSKKRLKQLMSQPSDVDVLLNRQGQYHEQIAGAADSDREGQYAQLMRFASRQVWLPARQRKLEPGIVSVPLKRNGASAIFKNGAVETRPIASWSRSGLFVTALRLRNTGSKTVWLEDEAIKGDWLAVALERSSLLAQSRGYIYLISTSPFEHAISSGGQHDVY